MEAGDVKHEDKVENDKADDSAERGSTDSHKYLAELAKFYSQRNEAYRQCLSARWQMSSEK